MSHSKQPLPRQPFSFHNRSFQAAAVLVVLAVVTGAICASSLGCGEDESANNESANNVADGSLSNRLTAEIEQARRNDVKQDQQLVRFASQRRNVKELTLAQIPFHGARAYDYLKQICALGSRTSGTPGMARQQQMLVKHFKKLGGAVSFQKLTVRHPEKGVRVPMANLIVQWHPQAKKRILLCAHYDTRPFPDRDPDPKRRRDLFLGANDGASGTALLMELAHHMPGLESAYGVDFVLFDGEEFVFNERRDVNYYFIGSTWFAKQYKKNPPPYRYRYGVLLDMVADADLQIYQEISGLRRPGVRPLVKDIWSVARDLKVGEFIPYAMHEIRDDHLPLNDIAKIPTCDLIDFDYPNRRSRSYWHTTSDTPENCSALSLAKVGWVVHEWLKRVK